MEKEGRGQERPQSWKCPSVGMGSKMEVVFTAPHISYRAQGEGGQGGLPGSVAHAPMGVGGKPGSGVPTHSLETSEGWITMQSGHRSNPTLSPKEGGSHRPLLSPLPLCTWLRQGQVLRRGQAGDSHGDSQGGSTAD